MKITSNLITKQEIDSVSGDNWFGNCYPAYESEKMSIIGNIIIFDNFCKETNSTLIKIFLLIHDPEKDKGLLEFLADMNWSSHVLDFESRSISATILASVNEYLMSKYIGQCLDNSEQKQDLIPIDCKAINKLYENDEVDNDLQDN